MRYPPKIIVVCLLLLISVMSYTAFAQDVDPQDANGFSGSAELGFIWINTTDQLSAKDDNEVTDALDGPADSYNNIFPLALFELKYKFQDTNKELYLKTPLDYYPGLSFGMIHTFNDKRKLDVSIFAGWDSAWKDPFITQLKREETDKTNFEFNIDYEIKTHLNLYYRYNQENVDKDIIGQRFDSLKRDGMVQSTGIGYKIGLNRSNIIIPKLEYTKAVMDGDSNNYNGYKIEIGYMRMTKQYIFNASVSANKKDYDKNHPIFDKTRSDDDYSAVAIFTVLNSYGNERVYTNFIIGYSFSNSNIDFYDKDKYFGGVTTGIRF